MQSHELACNLGGGAVPHRGGVDRQQVASHECHRPAYRLIDGAAFDGDILMNQNSVIVGVMIVGFIVYVTIKGRLPAYAALLTQSAPKTSASNSPAVPSSDTTSMSNPGSFGGWSSTGGSLSSGKFDWSDTLQSFTDSNPLSIF